MELELLSVPIVCYAGRMASILCRVVNLMVNHGHDFLYHSFLSLILNKGLGGLAGGKCRGTAGTAGTAATVNDIWLFQYSLSGVFCWTSLQITSIRSALGQAGGSEGRPGQRAKSSENPS